MKNDNNDIIEMHAIVTGSVQGVFFRATTRDYAKNLGITGTVRNVPDGTVEIYAQGTREQLERLLEQLSHETGPGTIESIKMTFSKPERSFSGFQVVS